MKYGRVEGIENPVSRIVFGCAIAPMIEGEDVSELLDGILKLGITTFDTAENYGLSEISLGRWIRA
ncbi:MAG: aldo/keto reductase [Lachnospiraceae bacterium]|nr:aldo/keto reductase [Lachnospiraceae bacterium]